MAVPDSHLTFVFGPFEFDCGTGDLLKSGIRVRLQDQSRGVLRLLLERPGETISRETIRDRLWSADVHVDYDRSLNAAIGRLRQALGDAGGDRRYIERVPRAGYRFIAPVAVRMAAAEPVVEAVAAATAPLLLRRPVWAWWLLAACLATALLVSPAFMFRRPAIAVVRTVQVTNDGRPKSPMLATDGVRLYLTEYLDGKTHLFQVPVAGGQPEKLPTPFTGNWPQPLDAIAERSEVLVQAAGKIVVWSAVQNRVRRVADAPCEFAQWSPDHSLIACATQRGLEVMDADGSRRRMLRTVSAAGALAWWPNGRGIRYSGAIRPGEAFRIRDYNLDNGADSPVLPDQLGPANAGVYVPHGWHVYASSSDHNLYAAQDHGDPVALTRGPVQFYRVIASVDGETLYAMGQTRRGELMRFDAGSGRWRALLGGVSADAVAFAPRGDRVAYVTYPEKELWTAAVDGSHRVQITANPGRAYHPSWSPDGQTLVYSALNSNGVWRIFAVEPGRGSPREIGPVSDRALNAFDPTWSPDNRQIAFAPLLGGPREELGIYVTDRQANETLLPGTRGLWSPRWAPDNSSIAALDRNFRLVRYDLRTRTTRMLVDEACGWPHWSRNGRWIYFLAGTRQAIARVNVGSGQVETLMQVPFPITGNTTSANWDHNFYVGFGPDDQPILLRDFDVSEIYALRLGWRRF